MLERNVGIDIVRELGGINYPDDAVKLFKESMDSKQLERIRQIQYQDVLLKIANAIRLCSPHSVFINTGSKDDQIFIRDLSIEKKEETSLPLNGHTIHFDLKEEQGRIIDRTFYIINPGEDASSLANKILRDKAFIEIKESMTDIMKGKTMIIGFYLRGPAGSPVSNPAIEISSSAYVSHSAEILYRNSFQHFNSEVTKFGYFFTNIHSEGKNRPEDLPNARVFMDRSHWTTYSYNCTYAGNTLLLKKGNHRFAVDKAVYLNHGNELSEHMFITGIKGPKGRVTWVTGAAPSGCGKTTTAMAGDFFIGDDLAQMWIDQEGSIRSINPEKGIFGIVEDVNRDGDPKLMDILRNPGHEVIFSNVLIDENGTPQWTGNGDPSPEKGTNFQGTWCKGLRDKNGNVIPISHPNARCTVASISLSNYCERAEDKNGVETKIITYSGRDSDTMMPVWIAQTPAHGVVIGACIVSAATATEVGATGVKRAPWANAPFIPGSLGDYMHAQLAFFDNKKIRPDRKPIIAGLNYFLTEEARGGEGKKLLGEKKDVKVWLAWLERMAHHELSALITPIGYIPVYEDLKQLFDTIIGKSYSKDLYIKQFSLYVDNILSRIELQRSAYAKEKNIPQQFFDILTEQQRGLDVLKKQCGPVVSPFTLSPIESF